MTPPVSLALADTVILPLVPDWLADTTGSFNAGFLAAAFLPLVAAFILVIGWGKDKPASP